MEDAKLRRQATVLGEDKRRQDPSVCLRGRWLRRKEKVKGTPRSPLKTTGKVTGTFTSLILVILWIIIY